MGGCGGFFLGRQITAAFSLPATCRPALSIRSFPALEERNPVNASLSFSLLSVSGSACASEVNMVGSYTEQDETHEADLEW